MDPCSEGNALENFCDLAKFDHKNPGMRFVGWTLVAIGIVVGDILVWFPQVMLLFPDEFTYLIANLVVDILFIIVFVVRLGLPGLITLLKLIDTLIIFVLSIYVPGWLIAAFIFEVIPWFMISVLAYYVFKYLVKTYAVKK
jgi:hypothetical protein